MQMAEPYGCYEGCLLRMIDWMRSFWLSVAEAQERHWMRCVGEGLQRGFAGCGLWKVWEIWGGRQACNQLAGLCRTRDFTMISYSLVKNDLVAAKCEAQEL